MHGGPLPRFFQVDNKHQAYCCTEQWKSYDFHDSWHLKEKHFYLAIWVFGENRFMFMNRNE